MFAESATITNPLPNHYKLLKNVIILLNILNIGNYTFLTYNISGQPISNSITELLIYARLPLSILPFLVVLLFKKGVPTGLGWFFRKNGDYNLLAIYLVVSSFFALDFTNSILYSLWFIFSGYSIIILLFFLSYNFSHRNYLLHYSKIIVYGYIVILLFVTPSIGAIYSQGPESVYFTSKTNYAYCLVAIVSGILIYKLGTPKYKFWQNLIIYSILFVCLLGLLGSGKRTAFIVANVLIVLFLSYRLKYIGKLLLISIPIFFGAYQGAISSLIDRYQTKSYTLERLSKVEYGGEVNIEDTSYEVRLMLWDYYLNIYQDNLLLGIGRNNRETAAKNYRQVSYLEDLSYHNTYLHILVEFGAIGGLLILMMIIRGLYLIWSLDRKSFKFFFLLLVPTLIINWFETSALPGQIFYWFTFFVWLYPRIYLSPYFKLSKMDPDFRRTSVKLEGLTGAMPLV